MHGHVALRGHNACNTCCVCLYMSVCRFVPQDTHLCPTLTVYETVYMAAKLRMGGTVTEDERHTRVRTITTPSS